MAQIQKSRTIRAAHWLMLAAAGLVGIPQIVTAAPACGPEIKAEIAKQLNSAANLPEAEQLKLQAQLYEQYQFCAKDDTPPASAFLTAARMCGAAVGYTGSLFYEEMSCCGYDPQRRTFACPVKVKQTFGFGPAPNPGSREYVLNCVADDAGVLRPVGYDSVHLADSRLRPTWQFAVVANAVDHLGLVQPMNGGLRRARSILSWDFKPTDCDYKPIWGNWLDYRIRLDQ
ncbi:hypothetical protein ACW73L_14435 [Methylolobus aquaticus]